MPDRTLRVGDLDIDVGARRVSLAGRELSLTGLELDLLVALCRRAGRVVPREALLELSGREVLEMDALVGELLAGARIDAGALQKRLLDVQETVDTCVMRSGLTQVHTEITHDAARVHADPTLLARALLVLLDNAKKHGGTQVKVRVERAGELLRFSVEDDGQGFAPGDLPRLFAPFARGRGQLPDEARGLGLYLVRRIAEVHGGEAFARNATGPGASVGFTLRHAALGAAQGGNAGAGTVLAS